MYSPSKESSERQKRKIQRTTRSKASRTTAATTPTKGTPRGGGGRLIEQIEATINVGGESERHRKRVVTKKSKSTGEAAEVAVFKSKETEREKTLPAAAVTPDKCGTPSARTVPVMSTREIAADTKKCKEKWNSEETARSFIDRIDSQNARSEFIDLKAIVADPEKCKLWRKNMRKNQNTEYPCLDSNIVKSANNPDDYINASSVAVPHVRKHILVGQMPRKDVDGAIEEFWKIIFEENVMLIHILSGADEVVDFFPQIASSYEHYGTMFVNNRKVERPDSESVKFMMEILPTGFSNSNICTIVLHHGWKSQNIPAKFSKTIKSVIDVINFTQLSPPDEKALIISKNGVGRAGFFLSLASAVSALNEKVEPRIPDIVRSIREQRPMAVESFKQYTSIYLCVLYYIKKRVGDDKLSKKVNEINEAFKNMLEGAGMSVMM